MNLNNNEIKEGRKFFSKIGFSFLGLTLFTIISKLALDIITLSINPSIYLNTNFQIILSAICSYIIPIPFFFYIMNKFEKSEIKKHTMSIFKFLACIAITYTLTFIGNMIGLTLTGLISGLIGSQVINPVVQIIGTTNIWVTFLTMVILAPIFEELFFRKLLIDRTIKYGGAISIIISATLFALYHGNLNQFFYAFLIGGFFAFIYTKTGRIEYTIALHAIINFLGSIFSEFLSSILKVSPDIAAIISLLLFVVILIGFILILWNIRKINIPKGEIIIKKSVAFLNLGMICFIAYYIFKISQSIFL